MPILTKEEYNKKKPKEKATKKVRVEKKSQSEPKLKLKIYHLLYPEIPVGRSINRDMILNLVNDKGELVKHKLKIVNNIVKTSRKDIADYLVKTQYVLIKEENNDLQ